MNRSPTPDDVATKQVSCCIITTKEFTHYATNQLVKVFEQTKVKSAIVDSKLFGGDAVPKNDGPFVIFNGVPVESDAFHLLFSKTSRTDLCQFEPDEISDKRSSKQS